MSAAQRLPVIAGTLSFGVLIAAVSLVPSLRNALQRHVPIGPIPHFWKLLVAVWAIINIKNLPFMWHYRVLRGIFYQLKLQPVPLTAPHLFKPVITSSYNSPLECDYNIHKSNSTYFSDLDVSRGHHVGALLRTGLARLNSGDTNGLPEAAIEAKGKYIIALGAVACIFRKEIKPFAKFEIWTRCLTWDGKWLYIISHIVKPGSVKPARYTLQPWRKGSRKAIDKKVEGTAEEEKDLKRCVYASSIAKYVLKKGRLTIAPEIALDRSNLLPPRPANLSVTRLTDAGTNSPAMTGTGSGTPSNLGSPENLAIEMGARLADVDKSDKEASSELSWDDVERERVRGLKIAECFDGLTALHDEFGKDEEVLGRFPDFLW